MRRRVVDQVHLVNYERAVATARDVVEDLKKAGWPKEQMEKMAQAVRQQQLYRQIALKNGVPGHVLDDIEGRFRSPRPQAESPLQESL